MGIRELELDQPPLTWYLISVNKCVSNPYMGNLDNSITKKKQGEMCFHFLGDLFAKGNIENELMWD